MLAKNGIDEERVRAPSGERGSLSPERGDKAATTGGGAA